MSQRGQLSESTLHYLIVLACVAVILGVGYFSFNSVQERLCKTESSKFQLDVKGIDREVGSGSLIEKNFDIPCDADEVYFIDSKSARPEYFANSIIADAVASSAEKNVFVVKDGEVSSSFFAGELDLAYPGYSCLVPRSGEVEVFAEGKGNAVDIIPGCYQVECTDVPIVPNEDEQRKILDEFLEFDCPLCPADLVEITDNMNDYANSLGKLRVARKYTYCPDEGITKVEIIVSSGDSRLKNFRFFEYIPKECISSLRDYLNSTLGSRATEIHVQDDPLIMWQFDMLEGEHTISYSLNTTLSDECKNIIAGIGIPEIVEDVEIEETAILNVPPFIHSLPSKMVLVANTEKRNMFLNGYVDDGNDPDRELIWSVQAKEPDGDEIDEDNFEVSIDTNNRNRLTIAPKNDWTGNAILHFTVSDDGSPPLSAVATLSINVLDGIEIQSIPDLTIIGGAGAFAQYDLQSYIPDLSSSDREVTLSIDAQTNPSLAQCEIQSNRNVRCAIADPSAGSENEVTIKAIDEFGYVNYAIFKVFVASDDANFYTYTCSHKQNFQPELKKNSLLSPSPWSDPCPPSYQKQFSSCCGNFGERVACVLTRLLSEERQSGCFKFSCVKESTSACQPSDPCVSTSGEAVQRKKQTACNPTCPGTTTQATTTGACVNANPYYEYACTRTSQTQMQLIPRCGGVGGCGCPLGYRCPTTGANPDKQCCQDTGGCTGTGGFCSGHSLISCSDSNNDGCYEPIGSATACPLGCSAGACRTTPPPCTSSSDCPSGAPTCAGGMCKRSCGAYAHGQCVPNDGYGRNYYRCNDGSPTLEDYDCLSPCSGGQGSPDIRRGSCSDWDSYFCSGPSRMKCTTWTTYAGSSALCLGGSYAGCPSAYQTCSGGNCVNPTSCTYNTDDGDSHTVADGACTGMYAYGDMRRCNVATYVTNGQLTLDPSCNPPCNVNGCSTLNSYQCSGGGRVRCINQGSCLQWGSFESCSGGCSSGPPVVCNTATPANLVATITPGVPYQENDGFGVYTVCPFSVTVSNTGGTSGNVGSRYLGGGYVAGYSLSISPGESRLIDSNGGVYSDYSNSPTTQTVIMYSSSSVEIGRRTITCPS